MYEKERERERMKEISKERNKEREDIFVCLKLKLLYFTIYHIMW
jgi:hypothetical protein